jgi:phosphonate utilization associated putative membrane protein
MTAATALLLAIALHVTWNLQAWHVPGEREFLWWALAGHLLLLGPWSVAMLIVEARWSATLVGCVLVSGTALTAYFLGLRVAYRHAPVALAYPIARSSPLFIALASALLFGESFARLGLLGIGVSTLGLVMLGRTAWRGDARMALAPALLAAFGTTAYSLSDKQAVLHIPSLGSQLGYVSLGYLVAWLGLGARLRAETGRWVPARRPDTGTLLIGALTIGTAYALVIHAMASLPAAYAVAISNGGIVIAALLSVFWFKEAEHRWARLFWAAVLAVGLGLVALA